MYLSIDQNLNEVDAKIDQNGNLIVQVKEEFRCRGFEGISHLKVRAATGIFREEDDFAQIIKQNRFDIKEFTITFKAFDTDEVCCQDRSLEESTHLSFERGRLYIREGNEKYMTQVLYEIGKLIYVKDGISMIYPTEKKSKFDIDKQPAR